MDLRQNIAGVQNRIAKAAVRSGRKPEDITLVAVSKTVDSEKVRQASLLGLTDFGENRPQALKAKIEVLPHLRWHLIGRLQTNKVKDVVGRACMIHSLDRWNLAEEINKRGQNLGKTIPVLLEVNIAGEEEKAGLKPIDVEVFLDAVSQLKYLQVLGLMTMAPLVDNPEQTRPVFRELYQLRKRFLNKDYENVNLLHLSMGMSQDYEVAIEEGATIVRVGTAIFSGDN
ncbi:YggS family pyridoxal phosphate-dependent enzyme [Syntrophomonas palmitatica]|uniref:YggS family pyridoxal phosphate-dependent enzyme n=1 Tax=Syntrophomonas palmitatica TaxID=402877 RepID=UPI0006D15CCA|nr:YggS family pyridoxal phosphate-dependent enzyme [Syntrophomonas palmitatica]